jgi:CubicO group peptidase (beta-lactamase class C family)
MKKFLKISGLVLILTVCVAIYLINSILIVGTGYSSKYLCSQVFLADRDPDVVFKNDVIPTHALFKLVSNSVDYDNRTVTAKALGFMSKATSVYREGCGCTLMVGVSSEDLKQQAQDFIPVVERNRARIWPKGEQVDFRTIPAEVDQEKLSQVIEEAFSEPGSTTMRNTQAIIIVYKGRIIAEKYDKQFTENSPILGWSMAKSATNALVGILVRQGKLDIMKPAPVVEWQKPKDPRRAITMDQLLRMSSGLEFEEEYTFWKDVTNMLYKSESMAAYAASKPLRTEPDGEWNYSGGSTNILAKIVFDHVGGSLAQSHNFMRKELFDRIGMKSAVIEPDSQGVFVGSSYMYATARDWARFGLLINNNGVWDEERILPEGWLQYSLSPTPMAPKGQYGAQFWLNAGEKENQANRKYPSLPTDLAYMGGFNQRIVCMIPSRHLVLVRMGTTHDDSWDHEWFIRGVLDCIIEP